MITNPKITNYRFFSTVKLKVVQEREYKKTLLLNYQKLCLSK